MRSPAALVSIESQPKWALIRIGGRTAFATIPMQSIVGGTALDLSHHTFLIRSIRYIYRFFYDSIAIRQNLPGTPLQGILPAQEMMLTISASRSRKFRLPWTATVISMRSSLTICSLKKEACISWLACLNLEWSIRREKKILARFATIPFRRACGICDVHPTHHTLKYIKFIKKN